jgi:hypothetical protein
MKTGFTAKAGKIRPKSGREARALSVFLLTVGVLCLLGIWRSPPSLGQTRVKRSVLGTSTQGFPIEAYQIGNGPIRLAFIGGIHGGYEWNTTLLAYQAIDFFISHPDELPDSISLYVVPSANPDGLAAIIGRFGRFTFDDMRSLTTTSTFPGRFNGNGVDLNRNWGYNWTPNAFWWQVRVSGGAEPFSEVESQILRDFLTAPPMAAVVFWHSAARGVYPGRCDAPLPQTNILGTTYAEASQYPAYDSFDHYPITGDATDWLCSQGIPAIVVELSSKRGLDWPQNLSAMKAVITTYGQFGVKQYGNMRHRDRETLSDVPD